MDLTPAQLDEGEARERLNVLLGLSGSAADWKASLHLPPLPAADPDPAGLERRAIEQRLDIGAARFGVDLVGRALALKRGTRFFPVGIEVGLNQEKDTDGTRLRGPQLAIALPIFDTGAASIARLEAEQRRAQRQLEQLAIEIRSEVRLARDRLIGSRALVETHEGTLLPKRREVLEQTLLHYNMMLLGVYDLLLARREETEAGQAATAARRDYWIARVRLERAVGGRARRPRGARRRTARRRLAGLHPRAHAPFDRRQPMISRRTWISRAALLAAGAAMLDRARLALGGGEALAHHPRAPTAPARRAGPAARQPTRRPGGEARRERPALHPGRHPERADAPVPHGRRGEGVSPRRRAGGGRVRAGAQGQGLGLQRHGSGTDDRGRRGRSRPPLRRRTSCPSTTSTGTACSCRTAWTASAG